MLRTLLGLALFLGLPVPAQGEEPKVPAAATVNYLAEQYGKAAELPQLQLNLKYLPPYLQVTWQARSIISDMPPIREGKATIDLRYAQFESWNDGRLDHNIMVIECYNYYPCYQDDMRNVRFGHGEIDYFVVAYASKPIANALNHLASFSAGARPKDPFD